jgi:hypothetical protein
MLVPPPQYQISIFHHFDVVVDWFELVYRINWILANTFSTRIQLLCMLGIVFLLAFHNNKIIYIQPK